MGAMPAPTTAPPAPRSLNEPWMLGSLRVPNRVLLAPLAGIGNWFVRLQAKRYGAGMAVSEMVSSHAIHYGNEKTCGEMLRIDPAERAQRSDTAECLDIAERLDTAERVAGVDGVGWVGGPVSIQLFGENPEIMRSAAAHVAAVGADAIDINMGCPVAKVQKTGAGAALLADPDRAVAVARAAVAGAGGREQGLPVTVKLRSGLRAGEDSGFALAHRLVAEAGVAAIAFHPRSAAVHHKGTPDYALAARLARTLPAPVILTGGMNDAAHIRAVFAQTGAAAVMLARGALGNPWLFAELVHGREAPPSAAEVLAELDWTIDRAVEHLGEERAGRYLRKFYPWYLARLQLAPAEAKSVQETLQTAPTLAHARAILARLQRPLVGSI
jgi:tRNA-dihydrouridine synthase B